MSEVDTSPKAVERLATWAHDAGLPDSLKRHCAALLRALAAERDAAVRERDGLRHCGRQVIAERDALRAEVTKLEGERIDLIAERDRLRSARTTRTGILDCTGREICSGDRILIDLTSPNTKKEYWQPEYEVVWNAPAFDLHHVGGDKDSDTARWYFRVPQKRSTEKIKVISPSSIASAPRALAEVRRAAKAEGMREAAEACRYDDAHDCRAAILALIEKEPSK